VFFLYFVIAIKKIELTTDESEWHKKYIVHRLTNCVRQGTMRHSENNSPKLELKVFSLSSVFDEEREDRFFPSG